MGYGVGHDGVFGGLRVGPVALALETRQRPNYELAPVRVRVYPLYKADRVCRVCIWRVRDECA